MRVNRLVTNAISKAKHIRMGSEVSIVDIEAEWVQTGQLPGSRWPATGESIENVVAAVDDVIRFTHVATYSVDGQVLVMLTPNAGWDQHHVWLWYKPGSVPSATEGTMTLQALVRQDT